MVGEKERKLVDNFFFKNKDFIYLFLERVEGKEKQRERNIHVRLPLVRPLLPVHAGPWAMDLALNSGM